MRAIWGLTISLLLLVGTSRAGLVHRRAFRNVEAAPAPTVAVAISEPLVSGLRQDQIPVTVIELQEPAVQQSVALPLADATPEQPLQSEKSLTPAAVQAVDAVASEITAPQTDILKSLAVAGTAETAEIAENIAEAVEEDKKLRVVATVVEAQRRQDDVDLLLAEVEEEAEKQIVPELKALVGQEQQPQQLLEVEQVQQPQQEIEQQLTKTKNLPEVEPLNEQAQTAAAAAAVPSEEKPAIDLKPAGDLLRATPDVVAVAVEEQPQSVAAAAEQVSEEESVHVVEADGTVRQVTQATPTQSSTPQNFVQFLQNTPVGQFITQLTGQQQPQATQPLAAQPQPANVAADEPAQATPVPTVPGFLNPGAAITSAVQNAAQGFVNSTQQAIQGIQQFASNLGTQFFGNQPNSDSTTPRPPGPIQSLISNFVGGNNNNEATTVTTAQPGPLQGILNFFQGGNRPQAGINAAATTNSAPGILEGSASTNAAGIDNKLEEQPDALPIEEEAVATNEVRTSAEIVEDSFEQVKPEEMIVVEDDTVPEEENVA